MTDLVERLREYADHCMHTEQWEVNELISEAIAALTPVLPEDVVNVITGLNRLATRKVSNYSDETFGVPNPCRVETKAADMLERLARRLELSPNHSVDGIEARDATIKGIEQRIAELEDKMIFNERWITQTCETGQIHAEPNQWTLTVSPPEQPK